MTTMRSLAIIALLIGDTSPALAQNAPPTDGYLPPLARRGTPLRTDHPEPPLSLEPRDRLTGTRTGTLSYPLTRHYAYHPYWWQQGQYHWSPFGLERWGYWCEGAGSHRLSC